MARPVTSRLAGLVRRPVIVAPMAGGPSTPRLVVAAAEAGALGFLAAGYKPPAGVAEQIAAVRAGTDEAFGVNVFVPGIPTVEPDGVRRYLSDLEPDAARLGVGLGEARFDDDGYEDKLSALIADPAAVVSFTFGCPSAEVVRALQEAGSSVVVTVTCPEEAAVAVAAGAGGPCAQGVEAGAHRGSFTDDDTWRSDYRLVDLLETLEGVGDVAVFAAGAVMLPSQLAEVLDHGAVAAQCGTAFFRCPESGAHSLHKAALADGRYATTAVTRAFSGRPARALVNRFVVEHPGAPAAYPEVNNATRPLRAAAASRGDIETMSLWAGEGYAKATDRAAGEVVEWLCSGSGSGSGSGVASGRGPVS
ncbi:MAG: nitronate monooxygenase [Actinomycetota bacterium]|nr:nitronate monooxygenase [Actinomycetota bacterium]